MQAMSRIFKDKPNHPAVEVALWTEYVVRHGGTRHLRSPADDMSLFQYLLVDVVLFLVLCMFIVIVSMIGCCRCCIGLTKRTLGIGKKEKPE